MRYESYYISSSGQPANGVQRHRSKQAAIVSAKAMARQCLPQGSGGRAVAWDTERDTIIYEWLEHIEGGYRTV